MYGWNSRPQARPSEIGVGKKESFVTFRSKLFINFILALLLSVALIAIGVTLITRQAFSQLNREHSEALLAQFQREFIRRCRTPHAVRVRRR